jgi:hypothetical protein
VLDGHKDCPKPRKITTNCSHGHGPPDCRKSLSTLVPMANMAVYLYENLSMYIKFCRYLTYLYGISTDHLLAWNPTLDTNITNCILSSSNSFCVLPHENSIFGFKKRRLDCENRDLIEAAPSDDTTTYCYPEMNATEAGTASNCNWFRYVMLGGAYDNMTTRTPLNHFCSCLLNGLWT